MNKNSFYANLYDKIENFKPNVLEIIFFVLFVIGTITISYFHEPWFDEFQSWGISKDNIYNLLFVIPHYEVHPPLWHLVLKCFTSFDIPAELSLKIPNLLFMFASVYLILFKSPFPKIIRLTLPFTYYIFYQHSIINRPYSMLTFALLLCTYFYKTKNTNPYRFICSLGFLALTSLYGMIIATALTLIWVYEIWNKQNFKVFIKNFIKDKRFFAMLGLFILCCLITIMIFPDKQISTGTLIFCNYDILIYFYLIFGLIGDITFLDIYNVGTNNLSNIYLPYLLVRLVISIGIVFIIIKELIKLNGSRFIFLFYFLITFFCIYIWPHHLGIPFILLLTCFWLAIDNINNIQYKLSKSFVIIVILSIFTQIAWSGCSALNEIQYNYGPGRNLYNYIKDNSLEKYKIFSNWSIKEYYIDKNGKKYLEINNKKNLNDYNKVIEENTNYQVPPILINPYYKRNIFENFNIYTPEKFYLKHYIPTDEKNKKTKGLWFGKNKPDIIIGSYTKPESEFFKYLKDFVVIDSFAGNTIWKTKTYGYDICIYTQKELYLKLKGLKK